MRALLLVSALAGCQLAANAQHLDWGHIQLGENAAQIYTSSTVFGPSGTVYSSGSIFGTCNFDPGASNFSITEPASSTFIMKRDAQGGFLWARSFSSGLENTFGTMVVDAAGNSYTFGLFTGSIDCDPGPDQHLLTPVGAARNYFLIKLDPDGDFVWARQFGQLETFVSVGQIAIQDDMLYCGGVFSGTTQIGSDVLSTTDVGTMFITKIDTSGDFQWAKAFGADDNDIMNMEGICGIVANTAGDVFVTGFYTREADFDPGAGETTLTSTGEGDAFLLKLDSDGDFEWATTSGGEHNEAALGIQLGPDGSIYQCGIHVNNVDIPSPNEDIFVARYSDTGTALWLHRLGGPYMDQAHGIDVDENGSVYIAGDFSSPSVDFDPGAGEHILEAITSHAFILKLTADGHFTWVATFKSPVENSLEPSAVMDLDYESGMLTGSGYFFRTLDMDAGVGEYIVTSDNDYASGFTLKLDTAAIALGIDEAAQVPFRLYPNPTNSSTKLQLENAENGSVAIFSLQGECVLEHPLEMPETEIGLGTLPAGTYLVEVHQNGAKTTQRLVKR